MLTADDDENIQYWNTAGKGEGEEERGECKENDPTTTKQVINSNSSIIESYQPLDNQDSNNKTKNQKKNHDSISKLSIFQALMKVSESAIIVCGFVNFSLSLIV